jgi:hypothetical protein
MTRSLMLECPNAEAVLWITETLTRAHYQVASSFDLRTTRGDNIECPCPNHGTDTCNCQMVVLLVYGSEARPASLVVHSSDGRTCLSLADYPGQRPSPTLRAAILAALSREPLPFDYRS